MTSFWVDFIRSLSGTFTTLFSFLRVLFFFFLPLATWELGLERDCRVATSLFSVIYFFKPCKRKESFFFFFKEAYVLGISYYLLFNFPSCRLSFRDLVPMGIFFPVETSVPPLL